MRGPQTRPFRFRLNGQPIETAVDPRSLLIDVIRDCGAKGSRIGCLTGDCGACSVELDGRLAKSCLTLAMSAIGSDVMTIEGYRDATAEALRDAFKENRGFQCGYCTSGMIMTAADLLWENPDPSATEIREAISGNLCRCTGYEDIIVAIADAASKLRDKTIKGV